MNYTTNVGNPTAHITKKKSRLKIYNGNKVFLNDGDNFEFELYNPKQKSVLAKIKLNGEYISNTGIVIKPGQRIYLERFFDTNNKFEFSTYQIEDNPRNRSAIDLNGDILVEFYDEQQISNYSNPDYINSRSGWTTINTGSPFYGYNTFTVTNTTGAFTTDFTQNVSTTYLSNSNLETGRVEKGELSNQSFTNSYQNFNYFTCNLVSYKILPLSTKNKGVEDIRHYCTECGTKVKKNFKFCPSCGNKI